MTRHITLPPPQSPLRLKLRFRQLHDGVVLVYSEPKIIYRDLRSAEWQAFVQWSSVPGNIVEIAPAAEATAPAVAAAGIPPP
jgi:hypothetical protein